MNRGGWVPVGRSILVQLLPSGKTKYTEAQATLSVQLDIDADTNISVSGYAKLWGWSCRKVNRFLLGIGVEIIYPERNRHHYKGGRICLKKAQPMTQPPHNLCRKKAQPQVYDNRYLEAETHNQREEKAQAKHNLRHTTNHTNTTDNRLTAKNEVFAADAEESYTSKKGRILTRRILESFNRFWNAFDYKKGKAQAADTWFDLKPFGETVKEIVAGAKREASARPAMLKNGRTPIMAQGWLSGRRWEDEPAQFAGKQGVPEWK